MKKLFSLLLILCMLLSLCACKKNDATIVVQDPPPPTFSGNTPPIPSFPSPSDPGPGFDENGKILDTVYVKMTVKDLGDIYLELDGKTAPITVANFVKLVNEGFYNGLTFHRVISGFMIQGGDPKANGTGGSPDKIVGEFSANGYNNTIRHERGVISMARSNDPNSASSQFFICNDSNASVSNLDGYYAAFGHVIIGMDVVDLITDNTWVYGYYNNGMITDKTKQEVITEVKVVSEEEIPTDKIPTPPTYEGPGFDENGKIKDTVYVKMTVQGYGDIILELDGRTAPATVSNFVNLVNNGFYNGLTFHRVINNFMIQGGDPNANGTGGSPDKIVGEFSANGYDNTIRHEKGVISMARSSSYNSASSQFFICNNSENVSHLDGQYAAFGHVISGIEVVDLITSTTAPYGDANGTISDKSLQAVITEVKVISEAEALG